MQVDLTTGSSQRYKMQIDSCCTVSAIKLTKPESHFGNADCPSKGRFRPFEDRIIPFTRHAIMQNYP